MGGLGSNHAPVGWVDSSALSGALADEAVTGRGRSSEMGALPDRVCLAQPGGELVIELIGSDDPEAMYEQALRVRTRPLDTRIDDTPLEVEIPGQGCLPRGDAGESTAAALECDRGLRD